MGVRPGKTVKGRVWTFEEGRRVSRRDEVATEEPLEISLQAGVEQRTIAITMRTPGNDFELAAGFLYGEGVVQERDELERVSFCVGREAEQRYNVVNARLRRETLPEIAALERHFVTTSACGVCGKSSLEALEQICAAPLPPGPAVSAGTIAALPELLRARQQLFSTTGGLHAAALFDTQGTLLALREDVGRHNAVDKLVGWALLEGLLPLRGSILLVSGRASFEIMQKALRAAVPIVCAISAPSSLAVSTALQFNMTLAGFLRGARFNVYAGVERVLDREAAK